MGVIEIMKKSFLFFFILFLFTSFSYARSLEGALIDAVNDNDYNGVKDVWIPVQILMEWFQILM